MTVDAGVALARFAPWRLFRCGFLGGLLLRRLLLGHVVDVGVLATVRSCLLHGLSQGSHEVDDLARLPLRLRLRQGWWLAVLPLGLNDLLQGLRRHAGLPVELGLDGGGQERREHADAADNLLPGFPGQFSSW
ncbi:hypothetical protein ACIGAN_31565 [Streptomyces sp. NPDC085931]|uniref:hypothetical protein n=1 Tax=Streptomyces sp. NPDC085931 TaxID=3365740 RepID=UPI0037CDF1AD